MKRSSKLPCGESQELGGERWGQSKDTQAGARCVLYDPVGRAALLPIPT